MSGLKQAWLIARRDAINIVWRREGIVWIFVMPIVFFYFIGTVNGGFGNSGGDANAPDPLTLIAPPDAGVLIDELVARLEQQNFGVDRQVAPDAAPVEGRRLVVGIPDDELPPTDTSLTNWALSGHSIALDYATGIEGPDAAFDRIRVARAVYTVLADAVVLTSNGETLSPGAFAALAAEPRAITIDVRSAGRRETPPEGFAQTIPGTMVMFTMLIALTAGAIHLVLERNQGLLRRLASAPIPRRTIVAGKIGGRVGVAAIQLAFAMLAGAILFDVDWGPSLPMVVVVLLSWAIFNATLAVVFGSLVRSEAQATGFGIMATMAMAALGGAWWPIEIAPEWMQQLAQFVPTGWTMTALHRLVNFAYGPASALPQIIAILAASAALAWIAERKFRYG